MNNKGFTLVELLGCIVIMGIIFGVGFSLIRGTRSTVESTIDEVTKNELYDASKIYVLENSVNWNIDGDNVYSCVNIDDMINDGYFELSKVKDYRDQYIKVIKNNDTKVIIDLVMLEECN